MGGSNITLGQNQNPPFSNREFEILSGVWSTYRYRETEDLMINISIVKLPPVSGAGIHESEIDQAFGDFYPNPSADLATINYTIPFRVDAIAYQLYDMEGRLVNNAAHEQSVASGKLVVKTRDLAAGIYTCKIIVDGNVVIRRLSVTK